MRDWLQRHMRKLPRIIELLYTSFWLHDCMCSELYAKRGKFTLYLNKNIILILKWNKQNVIKKLCHSSLQNNPLSYSEWKKQSHYSSLQNPPSSGFLAALYLVCYCFAPPSSVPSIMAILHSWNSSSMSLPQCLFIACSLCSSPRSSMTCLFTPMSFLQLGLLYNLSLHWHSFSSC